MGLVRPRSLIRPAVYLDPRRLTSINFIPRVKIDLSLSVLSREVSQLWPWGDPSRWTSIFFVHFLTCWFYEILWVPLASSLPGPGTSHCTRSPGTSYGEQSLRTKIPAVGVLAGTEGSHFSRLPEDRVRNCTYVVCTRPQDARIRLRFRIDLSIHPSTRPPNHGLTLTAQIPTRYCCV